MSASTELASLPRADLEKTASRYGIKNMPKDDADLISAIEQAAIKQTIRLEQEARAQIKKEAAKKLDGLGSAKDKRPTPQDIAVKFSRRVIAEFKNLENPSTDTDAGADLEFICGGTFFHIYDGHRFVMPLALVTDQPLKEKPLLDKMTKFWATTGMPAETARKRAIEDLLIISMPRRCTTPVYKYIEQDLGDRKVTQCVIDRYQPRFMFILHGDAPKDAELGQLCDPEIMSDEDEIAEAMKME